jgi:hypothetical protein
MKKAETAFVVSAFLLRNLSKSNPKDADGL